MKAIPRISLATIIVLFGIGITIVSWGSIVPYMLSLAHGITEQQNIDRLRARAAVARNELTRSLFSQWYRVQNIVPFITGGDDLATLRTRLTTIKVVNRDCAWIGFADSSGKVVAASGGVLADASVLGRPWFRAAIDGPYAGDKHEALLLARYLKSESDEPIRLLDLAIPVRRDNGELLGVLGMHVDWDWVRRLLRAFSGEDGIELVLLSRNGYVLAGLRDIDGKKLDVQSVAAAGQGATVSTTEAWPDGQTYVVAASPIPTYRNLPSFGWSILARQRTDLALGPARVFTRQTLLLLIAVASLLGLMSLVAGCALGRLLARLATAATALVHGPRDQPIPEET